MNHQWSTEEIVRELRELIMYFQGDSVLDKEPVRTWEDTEAPAPSEPPIEARVTISPPIGYPVASEPDGARDLPLEVCEERARAR
jgi:hypothetical protein